MSLNRCEQRVFDYVQSHPDERQYWQAKFQRIAQSGVDSPTAVMRLETELWRYYQERSGVVAAFKEAVRHEGMTRTSMKNLAELLLRLWVAPRPKPKTSIPADPAG